jgi:predicted nucleotidyltransferase component of viral defense system
MNDVLEQIFQAIQTSNELCSILVFKGARILNLQLNSHRRHSLDIDSNIIDSTFREKHPTKEEQERFLQNHFEKALSLYFRIKSPQRFMVESITVASRPRKREHPRGWNAFEVKIRIQDTMNPNIRALPALAIDIAAPEVLHPDSVTIIPGSNVQAYTVARIAGEKLRAFLTSLPQYRIKLSEKSRMVRTKDLYDIASIAREYPVASESEFWRKAGKEFYTACESRFVDCLGLETFEESLNVTKESYNKSEAIPEDISFHQAWQIIEEIVVFFKSEKIIPFQFPLTELGLNSE